MYVLHGSVQAGLGACSWATFALSVAATPVACLPADESCLFVLLLLTHHDSVKSPDCCRVVLSPSVASVPAMYYSTWYGLKPPAGWSTCHSSWPRIHCVYVGLVAASLSCTVPLEPAACPGVCVHNCYCLFLFQLWHCSVPWLVSRHAIGMLPWCAFHVGALCLL